MMSQFDDQLIDSYGKTMGTGFKKLSFTTQVHTE